MKYIDVFGWNKTEKIIKIELKVLAPAKLLDDKLTDKKIKNGEKNKVKKK